MNANWVMIYSTSEQYKASLLNGLLDEADINNVMINKQDSSYLAFGQIELYVENVNVVKAKHLIDKSQL